MTISFDAAVIGGGFFGCMVALHLRKSHARVVLVEGHDRLLGRASYNNQARVHNGYHYPRSPLTAFRSRVNFPRFVAEFADCVDSSFEKYYAVPRAGSKVTARQFRHVMERVGASIGPAPRRVHELFDPLLIEEVFAVQEYAFDASKLARRMRESLDEAGVEVRLRREAMIVARQPAAANQLICSGPDGLEGILAGQIFNCTYSRLNQVLSRSGFPLIPLRHEVAEMALVSVPEPLRGIGVTVMCGPFFSVMPFPPRGLHTLSHVRYTPHESWSEGEGKVDDPHQRLDASARRSHYPYMIRDAVRYMPILAGCRHVDSLWEVKTILPTSEVSDSRPILMRAHHGIPNFHCILGAKIDNVYDALDEIDLTTQVRLAG